MIDLSRFQFSVIYSVDVATLPERGESLIDLTPPDYTKLGWVCTERGPSEIGDSRFKPGRHRKHCNILTFEQFCNFIEWVGIWVEKCQTMGSLGAPGCGFGLAPAVPFNNDNSSSEQCCYVTPMPPADMLPDAEQLWLFKPLPLDFGAVEQEMWRWFDDGAWSARETATEVKKELAVA